MDFARFARMARAKYTLSDEMTDLIRQLLEFSYWVTFVHLIKDNHLTEKMSKDPVIRAFRPEVTPEQRRKMADDVRKLNLDLETRYSRLFSIFSNEFGSSILCCSFERLAMENATSSLRTMVESYDGREKILPTESSVIDTVDSYFRLEKERAIYFAVTGCLDRAGISY